MDTPKRTLLLVDDEAVLALATARKLAAHGYEVMTASSGEEAVAAVLASPEIDLVLMDINLGPGIDGTTAARRILLSRSIPVLFLSGHTEPEVVEKTEELTSYGYVVKGSDITVLAASIKMAFKLHESRRQLEQSLEEQRRTGEALLTSERRFRRTVEVLREGICEIDRNAVITYVNPCMARMLACAPEEMVGLALPAFLDDPSAAEFGALLERCRDGSLENREFAFRHSGGERRYARVQVSPLFHEDGAYAGAIAGVQDITESRQARMALERSEKLFRAMAENSTDAFLLCDRAGRIVFRGMMAEKVSGFSNAERLGQSVFDLIAAEALPAGQELFRQAIERPGRLLSDQFRMATPEDQPEWWFEVSLENRLDDPDVGAVVVHFRDVSERRRMEKSLRESEEKFSKAFEHAPFWMAIASTETGRFIDVNRKSVELTGYTREELLSLSPTEMGLIRPDQQARIYEEFRKKGRVEGLLLEVHPRSSTEPVLVQYTGEPILLQGKQCVLIIAQEYERTPLAKNAIRQVEARYQQILQAGNDAIFIHGYLAENRPGSFIEVNRKACEMTGYSREELLSRSPVDIASPPEQGRQVEDIEAEMRSRSNSLFEMRLRRKDGSLLEVELSSQRFDSPSGVMVLTIARDISERKRVERELEQALGEKSILLRDLQHRIKNSLTLITSLIEIEADYTGSAEVKAALGGIFSRVKALADLYRILYQSNEANTVRLDEYLGQIAASVAGSFWSESHAVEMRLDCDPVRVDPHQATPLGLILNELLTNALKYAFPSSQAGVISIRLKEAGQVLALEVANTGDTLPPGFNLDQSTGLGLQIVKLLTSQLRGELALEREPVTTFRVRVPWTNLPAVNLAEVGAPGPR